MTTATRTCQGCGGVRPARRIVCSRCWANVSERKREALFTAKDADERRTAAKEIISFCRRMSGMDREGDQ